MGEYLEKNITTCNEIIFDCDFLDTLSNQIPTHKFLGAVSSVAGYNGTGTGNGWIYQNMFDLRDDNIVYWDPQSWKMTQKIYYQSPSNVGNINYFCFYGTTSIDIGANKIIYRAYRYPDESSIETDSPLFREYSHSIPPLSNDQSFLIGNTTVAGRMFKYFQTGVESNVSITNTNWGVRIGHTSFYNSTTTTWTYEPGYSCNSVSAWVTSNSTHDLRVGGETYTGTNKYSSSNDVVTWKYTGTTLANNTQLWSGTGSTDMVVYEPFARNPSWGDNFNDNSMSPVYWCELQYNGGTVDETSNKLKLTIPSGTGQACAGYVTHYSDTIDDRCIEINVPEFDNLDEMIIMIATSQTTGTDPYGLSNWYRCLKTKFTAGDYDWYVQKKVSGTSTTMEQWDASGATGKLKIAVDDGYIRFYEGDNLRYAEPYALSTTSVYIYVYTSTLRSRNSGYDYMDDFTCNSYDSRYVKDDFIDTSYQNRWDWISGSATVESEV